MAALTFMTGGHFQPLAGVDCFVTRVEATRRGRLRISVPAAQAIWRFSAGAARGGAPQAWRAATRCAWKPACAGYGPRHRHRNHASVEGRSVTDDQKLPPGWRAGGHPAPSDRHAVDWRAPRGAASVWWAWSGCRCARGARRCSTPRAAASGPGHQRHGRPERRPADRDGLRRDCAGGGQHPLFAEARRQCRCRSPRCPSRLTDTSAAEVRAACRGGRPQPSISSERTN